MMIVTTERLARTLNDNMVREGLARAERARNLREAMAQHIDTADGESDGDNLPKPSRGPAQVAPGTL